MPVLSKRIVLDCFYLLIFYFEKFSTDVCRLPCAVNVNLNLSIAPPIPTQSYEEDNNPPPPPPGITSKFHKGELTIKTFR